jgi:hypothetical protein
VTRLFWLGVAAVFVLAAGSLIVLWRLSEPGPPLASSAPVAPAPPVTAQPVEPVAPAAPPEAERPAAEMASDRDPRNDVQRPADQRADLLQDERSAKMESAMEQLNRRTALRKEEMQANGEVRPNPPPRQAGKR